MSAVDRINEELDATYKFLLANNEISLASESENNAKKVLLMAVASYFENLFGAMVKDYVSKISKGDERILNLVEKKVIERNYHTWFDWKNSSATPFYGMFGEQFKKSVGEEVKSTPELSVGCRCFLEIGQLRNLLVHKDFATYSLDISRIDIYDKYQKALVYIERVRIKLLEDN